MLLGALLDAGASLDAIRSAIVAVVPGEVAVRTSTVTRAGLRALKVDVENLGEGHPHRSWARIRTLLESADLPAAIRNPALAAFARLADAEGRVHGIPPVDVHFHEVGSWDAIADIVGVYAALADLGVSRITAGPVAVGSGRIHAAHGDLPVPVPAVLELARGWQVLAGGEGELATPTGMALLRSLACECGPIPSMEVAAVGIGAGGRDTAGQANVVRVVIGTADTDCTDDLGHVGPGDERRRPGSPALADSALRATGGRCRRRVARTDPHEEGAARPHAVRARPRRRSGGVARCRLRADPDARGPRDAGRPRRAAARSGGPSRCPAATSGSRWACERAASRRPPPSSRTPRSSPGPEVSRFGRCSTRQPPQPRTPGSAPGRPGTLVRTVRRSERPGGLRRSRCRC